jgi:LEA14-like dessication related protein
MGWTSSRLFLLLLIVACGLPGCAGLGVREPLGVTIADLRPIEVGLFEQRYAIKARVLNPNDADIPYEAVVFDVDLNGKPFAKGVSNQAGLVPRFGEALIELTVVSGLQNILRQVNELTKGDRGSVSYRIRGRLHSPSVPWPITFDTTGELTFPKGGGKPGN